MFANARNELRADIIDRIGNYAANRPRALQTAIGCSALGTTCDRKLGYMILGAAKQRRGTESGWMASIGTAVHAWLETVFNETDNYLTEQPITVTHNDMTIPGTVDLYAKQSGTVIDFKIVGESTLARAKAGHISQQYSVQVQLYGLGLQQAGHKVNKVAIMFLPRNKELVDAVLWEQPFDPQTARLAIDRYRNIALVMGAMGDKGLAQLSIEDAPCNWCDYFNPAATELAKGCPGKPLTTNINKLIV